ncbi:MAG: amino acid permease [Parachlamydiales bacterium]|nr:amino acid permease [Parachlamydiales bacterium]
MSINLNEDKRKIGIISTTAIVVANMMGSGISLLPASFASIGSITIISWIITLFGALSLAYVFAKLGLKNPEQGGPVAYARKVSPILGYQTEILYWLANWVGNLAIAITGVEYLSVFYKKLSEPIFEGIATILIIWIFTIINFFGANKIAKIVSFTVCLLLVPVIGTAIFGWFKFSSTQFVNNWNVSSHSSPYAIFSGILLAFWAFIGIESASVSAELVKKPKVTIPFSTLLGAFIAAIAYLASTTVISGMFKANVIAKSGAPFAISFGAIVGNWVQPYVSAFTAIACLASLGSWMMIVGQAGIVAAKRKTLPSIFARVSKNKAVPIAGLTINSLLMSILMLFIMVINYFTKETAIQSFSMVISVAVLLTLLPYLYSCLLLIKIDKVSKKTFFSFIASILSIILIFIALSGAQAQEMIAMIIISLLCFVFFVLKRNYEGEIK